MQHETMMPKDPGFPFARLHTASVVMQAYSPITAIIGCSGGNLSIIPGH